MSLGARRRLLVGLRRDGRELDRQARRRRRQQGSKKQRQGRPLPPSRLSPQEVGGSVQHRLATSLASSVAAVALLPTAGSVVPTAARSLGRKPLLRLWLLDPSERRRQQTTTL
jgi:hypothetical protein